MILDNVEAVFPVGTQFSIEAIRAAFPTLSRQIYLNCGTYGPLSTRVTDILCDWYRMLEQEGPWSPPAIERNMGAYEATRGKVAALLGVDVDEIALTRSVTDGTNIVAHGLRWQADDEVIVSDQEHESGWVVWQQLRHRYGIRVKVLGLVADEDTLLLRLDALMTPRTRLVFLSHVSCQTGLRIPVAEVGRFIHERGSLFMLDGAHAVGQFPIHVRELHCDFYTGCGHKWLMGPQGTGFLYLAREHLDAIEPMWVGWGSRAKSCKGPGDEQLLWAEGGRRYECATRSWALYAGLGAAVDLIQEIGPANIQMRVQSLVAPFKAALRELPRMRVLTPFEPERSAGLVSIEFSDYDHEELSGLYERRRILVPYRQHEDGTQWMRFAVAFYTLESELDTMLAVLKKASVRVSFPV